MRGDEVQPIVSHNKNTRPARVLRVIVLAGKLNSHCWSFITRCGLPIVLVTTLGAERSPGLYYAVVVYRLHDWSGGEGVGKKVGGLK